jgi:hypothetical protein
MWRTRISKPDDRTRQFSIAGESAPLSYAEVLRLWRSTA